MRENFLRTMTKLDPAYQFARILKDAEADEFRGSRYGVMLGGWISETMGESLILATIANYLGFPQAGAVGAFYMGSMFYRGVYRARTNSELLRDLKITFGGVFNGLASRFRKMKKENNLTNLSYGVLV